MKFVGALYPGIFELCLTLQRLDRESLKPMPYGGLACPRVLALFSKVCRIFLKKCLQFSFGQSGLRIVFCFKARLWQRWSNEENCGKKIGRPTLTKTSLLQRQVKNQPGIAKRFKTLQTPWQGEYCIIYYWTHVFHGSNVAFLQLNKACTRNSTTRKLFSNAVESDTNYWMYIMQHCMYLRIVFLG